MSEANEELIRHYWQRIWIDGDLDALDELVADNSTRHTTDQSQSLSRSELRSRIAEAIRAVHVKEIDFGAIASIDDAVWARMTMRGISLATMAPLAVTWMVQYTVHDGKIVESWALHKSGLDWSAQ